MSCGAVLRQLLPAHAVLDVLCKLQNRHAKAQRTAERIKGRHGAALLLAFLRHQPRQIIRAGKAAGEHDSNDTVIALFKNLAELCRKILHPGQRGLRQLSRVKPLVHIRSPDVHTV